MDSLNQKALELLEKNTRTAEYKGRIYKYAVPSEGPYPFQWLWDSCFHAISFAALGETERAQEELRGLFARQKDDGAIYHIIFWRKDRLSDYLFEGNQGFGRFLENRGFWLPFGFMKPPETTAYTQPPVLARAVEYIYEKSGDEEFVKEVLSSLFKYYQWLYRVRDHDKDGLISIFTQFESGLDYSPAYDETIGYKLGDKFPSLSLRSRIPQVHNKLVLGLNPEKIFEKGKFHHEDISVNSILIQALHSLEHLANAINNEEIASWARQNAKRSLGAILEKSYDKETGLFYNLSGNGEEMVKVKTIGSLMPLIISDLPKDIAERMVEEHLKNLEEFFAQYPVASTAMDEPHFTANSMVEGQHRIWRGPLSMNTNWFLMYALRQHGHGDVADYIAERSRKLVNDHGFWEFFNPKNGKPLGADNFGWATLVADM